MRLGAVPFLAASLTLSGAALLAGACSSDGGGSAASGGAAGSGGSSGASGSGGSGGSDASVGGTGGSDAGSDAPVTDGWVPTPAPGDIDFEAKNPLPSGEQLLFNDWTPQPNTVSSIKPDGTGETVVFRAYRVWSMGVSHDASKIAFACGDPMQLQHYGLNLGDAIQNTWLYDVAGQTASILSFGNINDECHTFNAKDDTLYVCRRYDFAQNQGTFTNKGYRLGRVPLATGDIDWLGAEPPVTTLELHPQPSADESVVYYTLIEIAGGKQTRKIVKKALPGGTPETIRENAGSPVLSPDGTRLLFADSTDKGALYTMKTDGTDVVKVATHPGTEGNWSPDGTKIAFLWAETQSCNHIEVVAADGSEVNSPFRVRDCGSAFITELEWIDKK